MTASAAAAFESSAFVVPVRVVVPDPFPTEPTTDTANFLTWDAGEGAPAVRFLVPTGVYRPGETTVSAVPDDYVGYLLSQADHGATFSDRTELTVGGRPATIVTATVPASLDGSLGCQAPGIAAVDCYGLQPELTFRVAVIDVGGTTLLVWWRHPGVVEDSADEFAAFEAMLTTLELGDLRPALPTPSVDATATSLDGRWTTSFDRRALATSPLLEDPDEVNDQNWGELVLTFRDGRFTYEQSNPKDSYSSNGTFSVEGDTVTFLLDTTERFVARWRIDGDTLLLTRDAELGGVPTPYVLQAWERGS